MPASEFAFPCLAVAFGLAAGVVAFAPLSLAIRTARRARAVGIGCGLLAASLSFAVLIAGVLIARATLGDLLLAFVLGELIGFIGCWVVVAVRTMVRKEG